MLTITDLTITYPNGHQATRDVNLTIAPGEILALAGETGSGKSTIAKALLGLLPPGSTATGLARLDELDLTGRSPRDWEGIRGSRIGVVPQGAMTGLNPVRRISDQLIESVRVHTHAARRPAAARALDLLRQVRLPANTADVFPHQLSGGQRQRVAIALALAGDPQLLVADEPTTGLDLVTQNHILDLLAELRTSQQVGMLLISHDLPALRGIADRVAVMYSGTLVESGPAAEPAHHPYTRALLAAMPSLRPDVPWVSIPGAVPDRSTSGGGCAFADRCPWAAESCHLQRPLPVPVKSAVVACHHPSDDRQLAFPTAATPGRQAVDKIDAEARPVVRLGGVGHVYRSRHRRTTALAGLDLQVHAGQIVGVVGESGSGKSTLGQILLGLLRPTTGRVEVAGADLTRLRGRQLRGVRHRLGFVAQDPYGALHPAMTVADLVAEPLRIAGTPRHLHPARISRALDRAGLPTDLTGKRPDQLSGGQRQRVAIARALAGEPVLLIADEATSMLDVSTRAGIATTLRHLADGIGLAVLFITHDLGEAVQNCDQIVVLHEGVPVQQGSPGEVIARPNPGYPADLVAAARRHAGPSAVPSG
ncbi:ABC transporter ATP-binding protein [Micromonospora endophytica]|uniref:ABC transporter ATP-binding protein n=1 Tax=Micromonospora endophytica TaxID=515350 RepID=A0A2W2C6Y5_9ACTN|nr:ABC transporter ATP-binding protein [Micromonospora endophytica]PZF95255.1 ABC transporter ATP-binding protein [Micromonospora endophytica]RIW50832.1 ABC transporter ATP-binding protein [Micromonospora endophytica]BCJ58395.1 putative ABC transporter ATP-binding protein [Micromonospora endophytica]